MPDILVVVTLLSTLQVVTGPHVYDTSNYIILQEPREENFTFFDAKCRGKLGQNKVNEHIFSSNT